MRISGGIYKIDDLQVFSSGKRKQTIVLYTREKKSRKFEIHFYDENIEQLVNIQTRDSVVIKFDLQSEVFEDKDGDITYFTHIIGLKVIEHIRWH